MDHLKRYESRNKRRRASRNRGNRNRKRSGETSYYMSRSKYGSSSAQTVNRKYLAIGGIVVILLLAVIFIFALRPFSGKSGGDGQVASGSSATAQVSEETTPMPTGMTAVPDATGTPTSSGAEQTTPDPDGIASDIAAVPTLAPKAVPTPTVKPRSKAVALTFDDGPSTENTPKVLKLLKKYNAHATFFVVGTRVASGADILKQEIAQGCEIGNHSWDHANLSLLNMGKVNQQINKTNKLVKKVTGYDVSLLRPPYGAISQTMRNKLKHRMILWNTDTLDWKSRNPKAILKQVKKNVRDGGIILMHDIHATTAESLKTVLPWLVKNDYDILTVSELAEREEAKMKNGKAYGGFTG